MKAALTQVEILEGLRRLPAADRLLVIESALRVTRSDLDHAVCDGNGMKQRMAEAAKVLLHDYASGGELTAFTALDGEEFHAPR